MCSLTSTPLRVVVLKAWWCWGATIVCFGHNGMHNSAPVNSALLVWTDGLSPRDVVQTVPCDVPDPLGHAVSAGQ